MIFGGERGGGRDRNSGGRGGARGPWLKYPPHPTKTGRKLKTADRLVGKEVDRRRQNNGLGDGDKIFVRPSVKTLTVRSAIGAHRILGRHAIAELTIRPAIATLKGY